MTAEKHAEHDPDMDEWMNAPLGPPEEPVEAGEEVRRGIAAMPDEQLTPDKWRMDAYYYGFDRTGVDAIDKILSAVACAGKAFHHTEWWNEDGEFGPRAWPPHTGGSCIDWIQNAANEAAEMFRKAGDSGGSGAPEDGE